MPQKMDGRQKDDNQTGRDSEVWKTGKGTVFVFTADQYHLWSERIRKKYVDAVFESDDVWTGKESGQKMLDTYKKYEPWDAPAYFSGSMIFETGEQQFFWSAIFIIRKGAHVW